MWKRRNGIPDNPMLKNDLEPELPQRGRSEGHAGIYLQPVDFTHRLIILLPIFSKESLSSCPQSTWIEYSSKI